MEGGAFHADEFGGARDVAAEAIDLGQEIFPLEDLACFAQSEAHKVFGPAVDGQGDVRPDFVGQHFGRDDRAGIAASQDHQPLDIVAQLTHIAGPIVGLEDGDGIFADPARGKTGALRNLADEIVNEVGDVFAAFGQTGDAQGHDVEAVEEIFAEAALRHVAFQIAGG